MPLGRQHTFRKRCPCIPKTETSSVLGSQLHHQAATGLEDDEDHIRSGFLSIPGHSGLDTMSSEAT